MTAKIDAPKGFTTITLYHDSFASRKGDRGWKVMIPLSAHMIEAVQLDISDGIWESNGQLMFEEAVKAATEVVRERLHRVPKWETNPTGGLNGAGVATWRF